jgi:hypothetical protein
MFNLSSARPKRNLSSFAGGCGAVLLLMCSFSVGCKSEHIINTDDEFQHLYSVRSGAAISKGNRNVPAKQWAVGIKFDMNGSDREYLNRITVASHGKRSIFECAATTLSWLAQKENSRSHIDYESPVAFVFWIVMAAVVMIVFWVKTV